MKKLLAFITIASLTLGTATFAFADVEVNEAEATEEVAETEESEEEVAEEIAPAVEEVVPVALRFTERQYVNNTGFVIGTYPDLNNNSEIASKIVFAIETAILDNPNLDTLVNNDGTDTFTYEIEELATVSKISVIFNFSMPNLEGSEVIFVAYVDNATGAEITAEEFEAALSPSTEEEVAEEAEEVEEETEEEAEEAAEPVLVPVRAYAEALGFEVIWNPEGSVEITNGTDSTVIVLDVNSYTTFAGEVVELDSAPVFVDGTVYVTVEFFAEILGANVIVNADGSVVITGAVNAEATEETEEESEEVAEETEEETEESEEETEEEVVA